MEKQQIIRCIIDIPYLFYANRSVSFAFLLQQSGYIENKLQILIEDIKSSLKPQDVQYWFRWSDDKRISSGWFFRQEWMKYIVAYYPLNETSVYDDILEACATYILLEIGD